MDENEEVADIFEGVKLWWAVYKDTPRTQSFSFYPEMEEKRYYKLTFQKFHRDFVCKTYINHVLQEGKAITLKNRQRKLCTNNPSQNWNGYKSPIKMAKEEAIKKAEEEARLKAEKEEKEKKDAAEKDVKVDESLAKEVKENGVEVVKDDKALAKEVKENGVTA
ncbi:AAA-ATPase ASD, mitochondrial-like [Fagus crenata]